jgi:hypothetical protein
MSHWRSLRIWAVCFVVVAAVRYIHGVGGFFFDLPIDIGLWAISLLIADLAVGDRPPSSTFSGGVRQTRSQKPKHINAAEVELLVFSLLAWVLVAILSSSAESVAEQERAFGFWIKILLAYAISGTILFLVLRRFTPKNVSVGAESDTNKHKGHL